MAFLAAELEFAHRIFAPRIAYLIGTRDNSGAPNLIPVSNVTCVSRDPQLIVLAVYKKWQTFQNLSTADGFAVSVPFASQITGVWKLGAKYSKFKVPQDIAKLTASGLPIDHKANWYGPVLGDCIGAANCKITHRVSEGAEGDHGIFVAEIVAALFNPRFLRSNGTYKRNSKPLMQVAENEFATSARYWKVPFFEVS